MKLKKSQGFLLVAAVALAVGSWASGYAAGASTLKTPNTVIHHVAFQWKASATEADKAKVVADLKAIVSEVPGALNLWVKSVKVQPQGFSQTFVIEFADEAALKAYAAHPKKKAWNDLYYSLREVSHNNVTTN